MSNKKPEEMLNFIPYQKVMQALQDRLQATPEELAAWVFMGPEQGGLAAYLDVTNQDLPQRFYYDTGRSHDYLSPLIACSFREDDITNFQPTNYYITGEALLEHWVRNPYIRPGAQLEAFIRIKIDKGQLIDFHPTFGLTQWSFPDDEYYPPIESALFVRAAIEQIEVQEFGEDQLAKIEGRTPDSENPDEETENIAPPHWENLSPQN